VVLSEPDKILPDISEALDNKVLEDSLTMDAVAIGPTAVATTTLMDILPEVVEVKISELVIGKTTHKEIESSRDVEAPDKSLTNTDIYEKETTEIPDDNTADEILTDISEDIEEIKIDALAGVDDTNNNHVDALAGINISTSQKPQTDIIASDKVQDHTGENSNMKGIGITNNNHVDAIAGINISTSQKPQTESNYLSAEDDLESL